MYTSSVTNTTIMTAGALIVKDIPSKVQSKKFILVVHSGFNNIYPQHRSICVNICILKEDIMPAAARLGDPISYGDVMAQGSGDCFTNGMPNTRLGDLTAGHCFPPVPLITSASTVYFNNILAGIVTSQIPSHSCGDTTHSGAVSVGSPDCFIESPGQPVTIGIDTVPQYIKSSVPVAIGAEQHDDDEGSDPVYQSHRAIVSTTPIKPIKTTEPVPYSKATVPNVSSDCADIYDAEGVFPGSFQLSPNFTLAELTTDTLVSDYVLRPQRNLTTTEIVCNLRALCVNVLEPLLAKYGSTLRINSGFRHGSGSSQHYVGEAVDVSFTDVRTSDQVTNRAQEMVSLVTFDDFIVEQNMSIWFHFSYKQSGENRKQVRTKPRGNTYYAGIVKIIV
jgi:zinc D-Ala-D-Ala carboxypeptidase